MFDGVDDNTVIRFPDIDILTITADLMSRLAVLSTAFQVARTGQSESEKPDED